MNQFSGPDRLVAYLGLNPTVHQSGCSDNRSHFTAPVRAHQQTGSYSCPDGGHRRLQPIVKDLDRAPPMLLKANM